MLRKDGELLYNSYCLLGESPVWDSECATLWWVDIEGRIIFEYDWETREVTKHPFEHRVSLVIPGKNEELIVAFQGGVGKYLLKTKELNLLTDLGMDWTNHRCNDGACDASGRLWVGTMELSGKEGQGNVYLIDKDFTFETKVQAVSIPNGMAWKKDGTGFYHTDSVTKQIRLYTYNKEPGDIAFERTVVEIELEDALPDGMALDEEGMLWVALWGGYGVARYNPSSGKMLSFVDIPAPNVTSCAFAGINLDTLVITTAKTGLSEEQLKQYPHSGNLFIADPGVRGIARHRCSL